MSDSWYRDPPPDYTDQYGTLTSAQWLNPAPSTHGFTAFVAAVNMELMDDYWARWDAATDALFGFGAT